MPTKKSRNELDPSTEEKIKTAAREIFHKKSFAATRTREIAEAAGINLALLNYYFRSKQSLFDEIMRETLQDFFHSMILVFNDAQTTLEQKIEAISERYIEQLIANPNVPNFLLNELQTNPTRFAKKMKMKQAIMGSVFFAQFQERMRNNGKQVHPINFILNLMGLIIFPFVASPIFKWIGEFDETKFISLMQERKALIPIWIKTMVA